MAEAIIMPKAGMAMETGVIIKWLKQPGDKIEYGEPLLEIETDKTSMQVEAMNSGYLLGTLYNAGAEVPVVTTIGYIGKKGESMPEKTKKTPQKSDNKADNSTFLSTAPTKTPAPSKEKIPATPLAKKLAKEQGIDLSSVYKRGMPVKTADIKKRSVKATPLAKRIADIKGVELYDVKGSGYMGKIFSSDIPLPDSASQNNEDTFMPFTAIRKTIARRMSESHSTVPPVTLNQEADVTLLYELRKQLNESKVLRISFNDIALFACARALKEFPCINAHVHPDGITIKKDINTGMAVAVKDGLIVPVIHNADTLTLAELSHKTKELAVKAREGKLLPDDYSGGTFTVSNLGMFGVHSFTPIINMPEACILGVCAICDRVTLDSCGIPSNRKFMGLSLTFDHRGINGAEGANFLQRVVSLLEKPMELFI